MNQFVRKCAGVFSVISAADCGIESVMKGIRGKDCYESVKFSFFPNSSSCFANVTMLSRCLLWIDEACFIL